MSLIIKDVLHRCGRPNFDTLSINQIAYVALRIEGFVGFICLFQLYLTLILIVV